MHFLLCHFLGARHIFLGQVCAEGKGSLQRAATVRTADRKIGQNVRRHGLDRLNASTIKQKKTPQPGACSAASGSQVLRLHDAVAFSLVDRFVRPDLRV